VWQGLLCAVLLAGGAAAAEAPARVRAAQRDFEQAYHRQDWSRAIRVGHELVDMLPGRPQLQYNLACAYALGGDRDAALAWLRKAAGAGFSELGHLDADPDLASLHGHPTFAHARAMVADNQRRRLARVHAVAASTPIVVVPPRRHDPALEGALIIVLHGYGDRPDAYPGLWAGTANAAGAVLAVPRGGLRVGDGWGWSSVDEAEAVVQRILRELGEVHRIDPGRVVLSGFSQGAFMAFAVALREPELVAGVIALGGPYEPAIDAPLPARGRVPRFYFMAGTLDPAVTDMRRAADDFEAAGYPTRMRILPGVGHAFPQPPGPELGSALRWVLQR
jgi:phospholipase/carboxylesterase